MTVVSGESQRPPNESDTRAVTRLRAACPCFPHARQCNVRYGWWYRGALRRRGRAVCASPILRSPPCSGHGNLVPIAVSGCPRPGQMSRDLVSPASPAAGADAPGRWLPRGCARPASDRGSRCGCARSSRRCRVARQSAHCCGPRTAAQGDALALGPSVCTIASSAARVVACCPVNSSTAC